jgi:bile acid:Na+ symporter, BASS family
MKRFIDLSTQAFPLWILLGVGLAFVQPAWFTWFSGNWVVATLALVMLSMGLTLDWKDFSRIAQMPKGVVVGFFAQYLIMPSLGWLVATLLQLPPAYAVGLILVACCPGGTASNVVTYLAKADVALSVTMTTASTAVAFIMTPLLTQLLAGSHINVDGWGLMFSTLQVIIAPVVLGALLNHFAQRFVASFVSTTPCLAVLGITLIVSSIIAQNATSLQDSAVQLIFAVFLLHAGGFGLGYVAARLCGLNIAAARTISIEVGMQNSGLGVVLARRHFPDPLTALPCAISSVMHSLIGSACAAWWRWQVKPVASVISSTQAELKSRTKA